MIAMENCSSNSSHWKDNKKSNKVSTKSSCMKTFFLLREIEIVSKLYSMGTVENSNFANSEIFLCLNLAYYQPFLTQRYTI